MTSGSFQYPQLECNARVQDLEGQERDYGKKEARQALAIVDALNEFGVGLGGGGSNLPVGVWSDFSGTATTTNQEILTANNDRTFFHFQNLSCEIIYLRFGAIASATQSNIVCPGGTLTSQLPQQVELSVNVLSASGTAEFYGWQIS